MKHALDPHMIRHLSLEETCRKTAELGSYVDRSRYAGDIEALFYKENTRMFCGNTKKSIDRHLPALA